MTSKRGMSDFLMVLAALALVALNGFFVAAEFSLVKLRQTRLKAVAKKEGLRGRILLKVHGQLDAYLSACQLGITLASLGLGWIGEPAFARLLEPVFGLLGVESEKLIHGVSFAFAFASISFLHIVAGELAPKTMAIRNAERVGLWCALPLYCFYWAMYPFIKGLNHSANAVLRWARVDAGHGGESPYSPEELKLILRASARSGATGKFSKDEWNTLAHALDFSELEVSDLTRPIRELTSLSALKTEEQNWETIYASRYSRLPYLGADGKAEGVIHLKDLLLSQRDGQSPGPLTNHLRPVITISPSAPALELFRQFQTGAPHFAFVAIRGSAPMGFLTLDNLLSALVGEIRDEFKQSENDWHKLDDGTWLGKGSLPIFSLERALGLDIENEELQLDDVESVGGLVMEKLGDIPQEGQKIEFKQFDLVVRKMSGPRVVLVRAYPRKEQEPADEAS